MRKSDPCPGRGIERGKGQSEHLGRNVREEEKGPTETSATNIASETETRGCAFLVDAPDGRSDARSFIRASERANGVRMSLLINSHSDRQKGQPERG